jgi:hypothetical protein
MYGYLYSSLNVGSCLSGEPAASNRYSLLPELKERGTDVFILIHGSYIKLLVDFILFEFKLVIYN